MANSITIASAVRDRGLSWRVEYYMVKAAVAVVAELASTAGHAVRKTYADAVLDGTASVLQHGQAAFTNGTLAALAEPRDVADGDLEFAVNEMWNAMSGWETG